MSRLISIRALILLLIAATFATATAQAQTTWYVDDDAPNDPGPGDPTVSDPLEDGSADHPFDAIQEGIAAAGDGDMVLVLDGTYTGEGNKNLDFHGKAIGVRSENGPDTCVIDCEGQSRGFRFLSGEPAAAAVAGFTITNGSVTCGGAIRCDGASPTITSCILVANAAEDGGGICCENHSSPAVRNCLIIGNTAERGGGAHLAQTAAVLTNCTIAANQSSAAGGGLNVVNASDVTVANCILSGNQAPQGPEINLLGTSNPSTLTISYSDVHGGEAVIYVREGCTLIWEESSIDNDPLFVAPESGDCHLQPASPCVDTGTNEPPGGLPPYDLDGVPRPLDGDGDFEPWSEQFETADMGAYEYEPATTPLICRTPATFEFVGREGDPNPDPQMLSIWNCGIGTLNWEIDEDCPWLEVDPLAGHSAGEINEVTLSVEIAGLPHGDYACRFEITDPAAANSPQVVDVHLRVLGTLHVPNEYLTIQAAIDAAYPTETVLVADGTYIGEGNKDLDFGGKPIIVRSENGPGSCVIDCENQGRGFYFHSGETADALVDGFTITNGEVDGGGGGVACDENSSPTLVNCEIVGNRAVGGGGVHCTESSPTIMNCTILDNRVPSAYGSGGGLACYEFSRPTVVDCVISANMAQSGGGIYCSNHSDPTFIRCAIAVNHGVDSAGGVRCYHSSSPHFINCTIIGNSVTRHTAGAVSSSESDPTFTNCVIAGNMSREEGGGVWCYRGNLTFNNCTIAGNWVLGFDTLGGGVYCETESMLRFANCILWGNSAVQGAEIAVADVSAIAVSYSDVCGGLEGLYLEDPYACTVLWGDGNIDAEPLFAGAEDYHLLRGSPCVNAGTNYGFYLPDEDIDGAPRLQWCRVDMGAYESAEGPVVIADCNENGELDDCDVYNGVSADENRNNIPDECEVPVVWHVDAEAAPGGDGSAENPFATIQEGIDAAYHGDTVLVADGTYTGLGNKELDFLGKAITVCSESGPHNCVIDCESDGRAFWIRRNEGPESVVDGFTITNGYVYAHGGGAHCQDTSPLIVNCRFYANTADDTDEVQGGRGGGLCCRRNSSATIKDCTFVGNTAKYEGGGISVRGSGSPTITGCMIAGNRIVVGSNVGSGGGVDAQYCTLRLENCSLTGNEAGYAGGGLSCAYNSASVANCVISRNIADGRGGGIYCYETTSAVIGCVVSENSVGDRAGGIYSHRSDTVIADSVIAGNDASTWGGGVYWNHGNPLIINCTIAGNVAALQGGGSYFFDSDATIANSVVWGNSAGAGGEITLYETMLAVSYSDVGGGQAAVYDASGDSVLSWEGGNIDADPLFVDPDGPDDDPNTFEDNDYRLSGGSPCIDAADNEAVPADTLDLDDDGDTDEPIPFDLDGNPRFVDDPDTDDTGNGTPPIVDMGAYEFQAGIVAYLDIKPGSCPNPLNRRSHGVLPVAIVGTADFDVTQMDEDTLVLTRADGVGGSVPPLMGPPGPGVRVEDVATPFEGEPCECHALGGDGIDDLSMKFDTEVVVAELELNDLPGGAMVELVVTGELIDGTPFTASDCIRLVPPDSGGGPDGSAVGEDARTGVPARRRALAPQERPASDSSRQRTDGAERLRSGAPESDEADRTEESQDTFASPLAACGALSPALLLTTLAGMFLLRCRRP